jgi:hypothetical protein
MSDGPEYLKELGGGVISICPDCAAISRFQPQGGRPAVDVNRTEHGVPTKYSYIPMECLGCGRGAMAVIQTQNVSGTIVVEAHGMDQDDAIKSARGHIAWIYPGAEYQAVGEPRAF